MFFNYTKSRLEPSGIFFAQNFAIPKTISTFALPIVFKMNSNQLKLTIY